MRYIEPSGLKLCEGLKAKRLCCKLCGKIYDRRQIFIVSLMINFLQHVFFSKQAEEIFPYHTSLSSFLLYVLYHSITQQFLLSSCLPSVSWVASPPWSSSINILPILIASGQTPASASQWGIWRADKGETKPRKRYSRVQPKVMWG